jgi:hypothetical protein
MALNDDDLLRLLHSTEHSYAERKTANDSRDWAKTIVAFANTLDPSQEGVLFIGATNAGQIEEKPASEKPTNLDKLQKTLSDKAAVIYPPVYFTTTTLKENDRECLAVIVPGSPDKPHFAGQLFLRDLSETVVSTTRQYESLLAQRTSKTRELQKWIGKDITVREFQRYQSAGYDIRELLWPANVVACNQFYLTVNYNNRNWSLPLATFELAYDHQQDCLQIERGVPLISTGQTHDYRQTKRT